MSEQKPEKPERDNDRPEGPNLPGLKAGRNLLTWMVILGLLVAILVFYNQS